MDQTELPQGRFATRLHLTWILTQLLHWPVAVIVIVGIITVAFGWHLPKLSFQTSIYDMVVEGLPATASYNTFKKNFGSDEIIRVVIRTRHVFDPDIFNHITRFSQDVEKIPGIRRIISLPSIKESVDISDSWPLGKFAKTIAPVDLFDKNLISADARATVITLILKKDADNEQVIESIQEIISKAPNDLSIYQIGMPLVTRALAEYSKRDFLRLPFITLLLITIILWVLFRRVIGLVPPLACILVSLVWTFGFMAWMRIPLSMITMIVPVFLIAVGTAYSMHIMAAYLVRIKQIPSRRQAAAATLVDTAIPSILAVMATVVGLSSLWVNHITAIHEFALFTIFGMGSLLVILLTLFPALLVLIPSPPNPSRINRHQWVNRFLEQIIVLTLKHRRLILVATGIITLFCVAGLGMIRVETNPMTFFRKNTTISHHFHDIYQDLSGSFPVHVVLEAGKNDYFENPTHVAALNQLQQYLEKLPGVDKAVSFADYVKLVNYASNQYDPAFYSLPEKAFEMRLIINNYKSLFGKDMLDRFMDPTFSKTNILLYTHLSSSREFLRLRETIISHTNLNMPKALKPEKLKMDITGFGMVVAASSHLLTTSQIKSLAIALVVILLIMWLLFLSAKVGLIALIPNIFPIMVNFGVMGWFRIPLSMETSLIASIAIGLAVDDTIYYLFRYNREFKKDLDKDRALSDTLRHIGRPILYTTLAIGIGFSVLMLSHFKPTAIFGLLMVITMLAALVGDLIILPALMLHVELVTAWDLLKLMPALSGITAETAHQLNEPLNVIKMGGDYLKLMTQQKKRIGDEELLQVSDEICLQVDRATDIVRRLTASGEQPGFARENVNLNQSVSEALAAVDNQLRVDNISVDFFKDDALPAVMANVTRVGEVLNHLLINARDAIVADFKNTSGKITVRSYRDKDRVVITITDTGVGIPAHIGNRIFEPFFTTKASGKGRGLGLTICRQIVKGFDGHLDVFEAKGSGTIAKLTFPIHFISEIV